MLVCLFVFLFVRDASVTHPLVHRPSPTPFATPTGPHYTPGSPNTSAPSNPTCARDTHHTTKPVSHPRDKPGHAQASGRTHSGCCLLTLRARWSEREPSSRDLACSAAPPLLPVPFLNSLRSAAPLLRCFPPCSGCFPSWLLPAYYGSRAPGETARAVASSTSASPGLSCERRG